MTREVRADGATDTLYVYETTTSRLRTITDPKDQVTTYLYAADNQVLSLIFTNATVVTPTVSYTYDPNYPRLATMVDGTGTTTYTYKAPLASGAGQVATVDGPLTNDTIAFGYDDLGRMVSRLVNGFGISSLTYDALGRTTQEQNVLGTFTYGYDGLTSRVASVTYPNGQTSTYTYFGHSGDHRLQTIHHQDSAAATLSKFDYTYDGTGNIQTWRQQAGASAVMWNYGYDTAEQLTKAVKKSTDPTPLILKRYAYVYDTAGNRTVEQIDDAVTGASYNSLNRLTGQQPSGAIRVAGSVNEAATVTIQAKPATVSVDNTFAGAAVIPSGTSTFTVKATDTNNNVTTKTYEVENTGSTTTFTYDANGNLTGDGTRTFEWDARNQLVAVNLATHRSEFTYDGLLRRVRIVEKENSTVQSDTKVIWCETEICEERDANSNVTRRAFSHGEEVAVVTVPIPGLPPVTVLAPRYFARDHLGSVTEVTDTTQTVLGRYAFDPWGRRALAAGSDVTTVGYTGHRTHDTSALALTMFRGYDPALARWLSEDPASHIGGLNLYGYVVNNPIRKIDPYGLAPWDFVLCWWYYGKCEKSAKKCEAELRQCDMVDVMTENQCSSWGACVVKKCFVENPDCEKTWKYCGKSTIPMRPPFTR